MNSFTANAASTASRSTFDVAPLGYGVRAGTSWKRTRLVATLFSVMRRSIRRSGLKAVPCRASQAEKERRALVGGDGLVAGSSRRRERAASRRGAPVCARRSSPRSAPRRLRGRGESRPQEPRRQANRQALVNGWSRTRADAVVEMVHLASGRGRQLGGAYQRSAAGLGAAFDGPLISAPRYREDQSSENMGWCLRAERPRQASRGCSTGRSGMRFVQPGSVEPLGIDYFVSGPTESSKDQVASGPGDATFARSVLPSTR